MKRLRRWLFNFAAAVSLGMCVATVLVCIRSFWHDEGASSVVNLPSDTIQYDVESVKGTLEFTITRVPKGSSFFTIYRKPGFRPAPNAGPLALIPLWWRVSSEPAADNLMPAFSWLWCFQARRSAFGLSGQDLGRVSVWFPTWIVIVATGAFPALRVALRRKLKPGFCVVCGYDLRATPDRCPECGAVSPPASAGAGNRAQ